MLIHLGIFDDGDVAPTEMLMELTGDLTVNDLLELRVEAERLYGRQVPDHALFWEARPMVLLPDPELFTNHQYGDLGSNPGRPAHPIIVVSRAVTDEAARQLADPVGTADWDRRADRRRRLWLESPFAEGFDKLGVYDR